MFITENRTWIGVAAALAVFALSQEASAIPLTLTGPINGNIIGPQSTSNPCIIAATQCQQPAAFGFNNFTASGAISSYNMFSTTPTANVPDGVQGTPYTVSQLTGVLGSTFNVAIDVNTTAAAGETLLLFEVIINNVVRDNFNGPVPIGGINQNGNGFADWTLGVVDLSGLAPTDTVLFHASWNNASDGGESFFLVPTIVTTQPPSVPEPGTLAVLGSALAAMGLIRRRKRS